MVEKIPGSFLGTMHTYCVYVATIHFDQREKHTEVSYDLIVLDDSALSGTRDFLSVIRNGATGGQDRTLIKKGAYLQVRY